MIPLRCSDPPLLAKLLNPSRDLKFGNEDPHWQTVGLRAVTPAEKDKFVSQEVCWCAMIVASSSPPFV